MAANCPHMECVGAETCTMPLVRCSVCLGEFLRRKDGMVRYHGPHPKPCPGGGKPPAVMYDPLGPDSWARGLIDSAQRSAEGAHITKGNGS